MSDKKIPQKVLWKPDVLASKAAYNAYKYVGSFPLTFTRTKRRALNAFKRMKIVRTFESGHQESFLFWAMYQRFHRTIHESIFNQLQRGQLKHIRKFHSLKNFFSMQNNLRTRGFFRYFRNLSSITYHSDRQNKFPSTLRLFLQRALKYSLPKLRFLKLNGSYESLQEILSIAKSSIGSEGKLRFRIFIKDSQVRGGLNLEPEVLQNLRTMKLDLGSDPSFFSIILQRGPIYRGLVKLDITMPKLLENYSLFSELKNFLSLRCFKLMYEDKQKNSAAFLNNLRFRPVMEEIELNVRNEMEYNKAPTRTVYQEIILFKKIFNEEKYLFHMQLMKKMKRLRLCFIFNADFKFITNFFYKIPSYFTAIEELELYYSPSDGYRYCQNVNYQRHFCELKEFFAKKEKKTLTKLRKLMLGIPGLSLKEFTSCPPPLELHNLEKFEISYLYGGSNLHHFYEFLSKSTRNSTKKDLLEFKFERICFEQNALGTFFETLVENNGKDKIKAYFELSFISGKSYHTSSLVDEILCVCEQVIKQQKLRHCIIMPTDTEELEEKSDQFTNSLRGNGLLKLDGEYRAVFYNFKKKLGEWNWGEHRS